MYNFSNYSSVEIDSRKCMQNSIFVCLNSNYLYINNAIENGATLIISNKFILCNIDVLYYESIEEILTYLLDLFYPNNLVLIGVTGTDGKTSTCLMLQSLLNQNSSCGYIGTNGIIFNDTNINSINTTPDIVTIRKYFYKMYLDNIKFVAIECSSEGILANRLLGLKFDILIYTNISHEHLNTHKTMKNYLKTKISLINHLKENGSIFINNDDKYFKKIKDKRISTFGLNNADLVASNINYNFNNTSFHINLNKDNVITIPFFGKYNVYNCLACILVLSKYNYLSNTNFMLINHVKGRFEFIKNSNKEVIVDFAHTPNALENLLSNIKSITNKNIILVLGSAGGKDSTKRPLLGKIAEKYASTIIITSEDPKNELITNIFYDIIKKIKKEYYLVLFRKDAIKFGLKLLDSNSILVIVGKGKENYEQLYNYKIHHSDYYYTKYLLNT